MLTFTLSWYFIAFLLAVNQSKKAFVVFGSVSSRSEKDESRDPIVSNGNLWQNRSTVELTYHYTCKDLVGEGSNFCEAYGDYEEDADCKESEEAKRDCCACGGGKEEEEVPPTARVLNAEIMRIDEEVTATATFLQTHECLDDEGLTKRLSLSDKFGDGLKMITDLDQDVDRIVKHLCNINIEPLQKRLLDLGGDAAFDNALQLEKGNSLVTGRKHIIDRLKPGYTSIQFIFSSKKADIVYHFPWLDEWLPMLQETVLQPLGIPVNKIIRMMLGNMPEGASINIHRDNNSWVKKTHRVHVPIITHPNIFFLTAIQKYGGTLRIKSTAGEVYEFNNALPHFVRNTGGTRVHLIIDWTENDDDHVNSLVKVPPGQHCDLDGNALDCYPSEEADEAAEDYSYSSDEEDENVDDSSGSEQQQPQPQPQNSNAENNTILLDETVVDQQDEKVVTTTTTTTTVTDEL